MNKIIPAHLRLWLLLRLAWPLGSAAAVSSEPLPAGALTCGSCCWWCWWWAFINRDALTYTARTGTVL